MPVKLKAKLKRYDLTLGDIPEGRMLKKNFFEKDLKPKVKGRKY